MPQQHSIQHTCSCVGRVCRLRGLPGRSTDWIQYSVQGCLGHLMRWQLWLSAWSPRNCWLILWRARERHSRPRCVLWRRRGGAARCPPLAPWYYMHPLWQLPLMDICLCDGQYTARDMEMGLLQFWGALKSRPLAMTRGSSA